MHHSNKIHIAVVNVINSIRKGAMNKDLNGGFGTADNYTDTLCARTLMYFKKKYINLPIISLASLMGIFKQRGISAKFYEGKLPDTEPEVILIYGSIVDYKNENSVCRLLKARFKNTKIGFLGPFPSTMPELFQSGDFVIIGDFTYFFLKIYKDVSQLNGKILVKEKINPDELPAPDPEGFPIKRYSYYPAITKHPFFTLQASTGCPYSCSYYCTYGRLQGNIVAVRSAKKVVDDIMYLADKHNIKGFMFRDPVFGAKKGYIEEFCGEMIKRNVKAQWGMETRADILNKEKVKLMFDAGLRNINIGVETSNLEAAKESRRSFAHHQLQEKIIGYCAKIGIKITAFYIFGYESDTKESMASTLQYAKRLNTFLARFAIYTPYPGTNLFKDLEEERKIATYDYEKYTQFNLVTKHKNVNETEIRLILSRAYKGYYFRLSYLLKLLEWKARELWL